MRGQNEAENKINENLDVLEAVEDALEDPIQLALLSVQNLEMNAFELDKLEIGAEVLYKLENNGFH